MEIGNSSYYTSYNYIWTYSDEPHATRRKQILQKYPQIRELYGYEWSTKWIVICWVILQILVCYLVRNSSWWTIILTSYCIGAFASHALVLAMHEISHNLAFEKPIHNKLLGFFANLATVFPYYSLFQKYHMEHHQYQGVLGIDTDIPTELEKKIFVKSIFKKMIWVFFQLLFYAIRPLWIKPKIPGISEFINIICCIIFDFIIIYYFGFKSLSYLILSLFLGSGIHPVAGHFIAEHYVFQKGQETYSYYGPLNLICFNVGYHNEHHDFPRIPGVRLPLLKEIAPEFYNLPHYTSWTKVIWDYITNPNIGPYSRIVRSPNKKQN